ncbi:MAG: FHA domain-containing protein [Vicinamibacteria bacterium]
MRLSFAGFTLDRTTRQLLRGSTELHLEPKAFELLDLLLERRPAAVSKSAIQEELWRETFVSEGNVTSLVAQIRQALQDDRATSRFIRTVHGFGYAFCGEVTAEARARPAASVVWERQVLPLRAGANVVGRAEDSDVRIDAAGVSRHHARILLEPDGAVLEDLDSKNGTHLGDRRLDGPAPLRDGDRFRLGSQVLVFRRAPGDGTTATENERAFQGTSSSPKTST